jgi:hypothetical protein
MSIEYPPGGTPRIHEVDDFEEAAGHHLVVIRVNCPHKARASTLLQAPLPSRLCPLSLTLARIASDPGRVRAMMRWTLDSLVFGRLASVLQRWWW